MDLQGNNLTNQKQIYKVNRTLVLAIVISLLFFLYYTSNNTILMFIGVGLLFSMLLFLDFEQNMYLLFFFLSNERMLRPQESSQTYLSIFIMILSLKSLYMNRTKLSLNFLFSSISIIILMIIKNILISNSPVDFNLIRLILNLLLFYGFIQIYKQDHYRMVKKSMSFYIIGCLVTSILSFIFYWNKYGSLYLIMHNRYRGIGNDSNYYAVSLALAVSLLLILFYESNKRSFKYLVLSLIMFLFGALTLSRGFIIANIPNILLIVIIFFKTNRKKRKNLMFFSLFIVVFTSIGSISNRILEGLTQRIIDTDISSGRFDIWNLYIEHIFNNYKTFLFGLGKFEISNYQNLYGINFEAHNIVLGALADNGFILSFVIIISLYISYKFYRYKNKIVKWKIYYSLPFMTILFGYMFLTALTTNVFFWGTVLSIFGGHIMYYAENNETGVLK